MPHSAIIAELPSRGRVQEAAAAARQMLHRDPAAGQVPAMEQDFSKAEAGMLREMVSKTGVINSRTGVINRTLLTKAM